MSNEDTDFPPRQIC